MSDVSFGRFWSRLSRRQQYALLRCAREGTLPVALNKHIEQLVSKPKSPTAQPEKAHSEDDLLAWQTGQALIEEDCSHSDNPCKITGAETVHEELPSTNNILRDMFSCPITQVCTC